MPCLEIYRHTGIPLPRLAGRAVDCATAAGAGWKKVAPRAYYNPTGAPAGGAWTAPTLNPVAGLPATGDAGGTVTVTVDIEFHGHDIPAGGKTATITYNVGAGDKTVTAALVAGDTPNQATTKIAAAINAVTELTAVKAAGTAITVTPADAIVLSKLTLAVA